MNLFFTAKGLRIAGAPISHKNLCVSARTKARGMLTMECLTAPSLKESHFTLQYLRLLSSTNQSYIPVSQVSQSETRLVKAARAAPKSPVEQALQSVEKSTLSRQQHSRDSRETLARTSTPGIPTWLCWTIAGNPQESSSIVDQERYLKSQVLLFVTAGVLLTRRSTDRTQVTDQQASQWPEATVLGWGLGVKAMSRSEDNTKGAVEAQQRATAMVSTNQRRQIWREWWENSTQSAYIRSWCWNQEELGKAPATRQVNSVELLREED